MPTRSAAAEQEWGSAGAGGSAAVEAAGAGGKCRRPGFKHPVRPPPPPGKRVPPQKKKNSKPDPQTEKRTLQDQAEMLRTEMESIQKRLSELDDAGREK